MTDRRLSGADLPNGYFLTHSLYYLPLNSLAVGENMLHLGGGSLLIVHVQIQSLGRGSDLTKQQLGAGDFEKVESRGSESLLPYKPYITCRLRLRASLSSFSKRSGSVPAQALPAFSWQVAQSQQSSPVVPQSHSSP